MRTRRLIALERFGPPSVWVERPMADRAPGEVLVAVEAVGINFADTMGAPRRIPARSATGVHPGFEAAGRVLEGPRDGPAPGSTVLAFMEHAAGTPTRCSRAAIGYSPSPPRYRPSTPRRWTQGVTAWYAVHRYGRPEVGGSVVVHAAAGGVGSLSVQLSADLGARVIATASTEQKLALASGDGAPPCCWPIPRP